jgi:hypothetical protein
MKSIVTVYVHSDETGHEIATYSVKTKSEGRRVKRLLDELELGVAVTVQAKSIEFDGDVSTVAKMAMSAIAAFGDSE